MSVSPSQKNTSALEHIVSNLLGVVGSLSKTDMQGQAVTAGFRVKKDTGYTDKDVAFVKGVCHLFEPRYVPELWKEWKKKNDFVTGRNLLMKRTIMFATRTGIEIYPSIYIVKKVMEELMKEKINAGYLVPRLKYLERGNSIFI